MSGDKGGKAGKSGKEERSVVDRLSEGQAHEVLRLVAGSNPGIARVIEETARRYLAEVDCESIAEDVFFELNLIRVEEIWDRSGSTRDGYVDPDEVAWELFEGALRPYLDDVVRYCDLSMTREAIETCRGVLMGIRRFDEESTTQYREWAAGIPHQYSLTVLGEWKKGCLGSKDAGELEKLIK